MRIIVQIKTEAYIHRSSQEKLGNEPKKVKLGALRDQETWVIQTK